MNLHVVRDGAIAVVTLDRPAARNALSPALLTELRSTMAQLGQDEQVRAVVLTGSDPAFCAGLDLKQVVASSAELSAAVESGQPFAPITKPIIAAVNGAAYTGGLELALCCDIRLASDRASFADTHARVGVMPGWGLTVRLPRAIGQARALQMSLAGTKLDARTAEAWGLVNGVVEHERLLDTAADMARAVADLAPEVVARLLGMYREAPDHPTTEALARESLNSRAWLALRNGAEDDQQPSGQTQDTS